jgi:dienelactone hydrolase
MTYHHKELSSFYRLGILAICLCAAGSGSARAQTLEVSPNRVLFDEPAVIRASGLTAGEHVTIQADLADGGEKRWASEAEFAADEHGVVDTSRQAPVKGSYQGISALGLVWSMKPQEKHVTSYGAPHALGPQIINFHLLKDGKAVADAQLQQDGMAEGVQQVKVTGEIEGALFLPGTHERRPGVLVVGGSEGGLSTRKAAWLASRGYVAFALAYFRYAKLPSQLANIPLEYFGKALAWLMQRPEVLPDRVAVMGTSRGGELALQLGSMYPQVKAVVAYVPANVRAASCCTSLHVPAWTFGGQPLAFDSAWPIRVGTPEAFRAEIRAELTRGPILMISGESDGIWESASMADAVIRRLKQAHFTYSCQNLKYAHAGHRAGRPEIVPTWHTAARNLTTGRESNPGGSAEGDALSSLDAIPKVLEFLRVSLAGQ